MLTWTNDWPPAQHRISEEPLKMSKNNYTFVLYFSCVLFTLSQIVFNNIKTRRNPQVYSRKWAGWRRWLNLTWIKLWNITSLLWAFVAESHLIHYFICPKKARLAYCTLAESKCICVQWNKFRPTFSELSTHKRLSFSLFFSPLLSVAPVGS